MYFEFNFVLDIKSKYSLICESSDERTTEVRALVDQISEKDNALENFQQQINLYKEELNAVQTKHR